MGHWRHLLERAEEMEVDVNRCSARKVCGVWGAGFEDWRTWLRLSLLVRKWNAGLEEVVDGSRCSSCWKHTGKVECSRHSHSVWNLVIVGRLVL
jgi:hypothetical protein